MKRINKISILLLLYVVLVGGGIETINTMGGGLIQQYYDEYYTPDHQPSGSLKWRTEEGKRFQLILITLGLWVYPASILGIISFLCQAIAHNDKWIKFLLFMFAIVCLAILYRFFTLGVFTAATAF